MTTRGHHGLLFGGAGWVTAGDYPFSNNSPGWDGYTSRLVIPSSILLSASKIRFTLRGPTSGADLVISEAYVGLASNTGDSYDFDSTPTPLLFSGGAGTTLAVGASAVTDDTTISIPSGRNLVLSAYYTSGDQSLSTVPAGFARYFKLGSDASTVDASGYTSSASGTAYSVSKIELFVP